MGKITASKKEVATATAQVAAKLTGRPLGEMIDELSALREEKRRLEEQVAEIEGRYKGLEAEVIEKLDAEKTDASRGSKATASITRSISANIIDYDALCKWVKRTGNFQIFQRRVSDTSYRELLEHGAKSVPGLETFSKRRLNLRNL